MPYSENELNSKSSIYMKTLTFMGLIPSPGKNIQWLGEMWNGELKQH